jgi:hypothetical protein
MIPFLRKWYIIVALMWWLCGVAAIFAFGRVGNLLSWVLILNPVIVPAILLATRGFRQTTPVRVFVSTYAVALIPIGLVLFYADVVDNIHNGWRDGWLNTRVWFGLVFTALCLASPFVIGFSFVVAYVNNLFAEHSDTE